MKKPETEVMVAKLLNDFYVRRIAKLSGLKLKDALKRKNPYLFRAIGMHSAAEIIEGLLKAYMSSSDEVIFGDAFFEPLAKAVSNGTASPSEGADVVIETENTYKARHRQEFIVEWNKAVNRFTRDFIAEFGQRIGSEEVTTKGAKHALLRQGTGGQAK
jgi:hypothetical protein